MSLTSRTSSVGELAELVSDRVERHYGADDRTAALRQALARFVRDRRPVGEATLAEVEAAAQTVFRHLQLEHANDLVPEVRSPGWPPPDVAAIRRAGADLAQVRREADGTAVLRFTGLAAVEAAAPLLAGALTLLGSAARIVLDLRANGGGDPATLALIVDWLAGSPPRHLFDVVYADRTRQWWTAGSPIADPPQAPVRALIGPGTYSSGEALAWVLQQHGLATLVGRPTPGAADHVVPLNLARDVFALLPEARVVAPGGGPTWEGTGVQPDELADPVRTEAGPE